MPPHLGPTLRFLSSLRRAALYGPRQVYVDMSKCEEIGQVGCLIFAAEIDRCRNIRPKCITGSDPRAPQPIKMLRDLGFHDLLGFNGERTAKPDSVMRMKAGRGKEADAAREIFGVAELALSVWNDQAYADRIHAALNEALTNVIMHAYPKDLIDDQECGPQHWWIAGFTDVQAGEATFLAMDHGVGIPRTAVRTMGDIIQPYLSAYKEPEDHVIIEATIKGRRSQTDLPQHGKGLTAMIGLIENLSLGGSVSIYSGRGHYMYTRASRSRAFRRPDGSIGLVMREVVERSLALRQTFPGTLVIWKLNGPRR